MVRQPAGQPAADPGRRHRADLHRDPLLHRPERRLHVRRRQRRAPPGDGAVPRPRERRRALPADVPRAVRAHRGDRRAHDLVLRGHADAAGHGSRRVDVRRHRSLHRAGRERRPRGARTRVPLDTDERWALPNPTGLDGVYTAYCPPHFADMRAAVEAFASGSSVPGGPFNPHTPGAWRESAKVRGAAAGALRRVQGVRRAIQAQYVFDRFGKFPGTVPSLFILTYLQAHHLDLAFYDEHFGARGLPAHARRAPGTLALTRTP